MNAENYFISLFAHSSGAIGDDGALIGSTVYSKDAFFEGVHFRRDWLSTEQIAYKAMLVNISDAIAMNARPKYALLGVAMPSAFPRAEMDALNRGFERAAREYGVEIIGGDTISNSKLDITVTIVSETKKPLLRKGLKRDHLLAYTGRLGMSAKGLRYLMAGGKVHSRSKFVTTPLRSDFVYAASDFLSCGMDVSDGLFSDLGKISQANRLGFRFNRRIAKSTGCSGEEYEMLIGFSPRERKKAIRYAQKSRTPLTLFAKAVRGSYKNCCKAHHF